MRTNLNLFILALLLRLMILPVYGDHMIGDEVSSIEVASTFHTEHPLATEHCMTKLEPQRTPCPVSYRPPLYPFLLSFFNTITQMRLFNIIIASLIIFPTYYLAKHYYGGEVALFASLLVAIHPFLIFKAVQLTNRSLIILLFITAYYFVVKKKWLHFALLAGLGYLANQTIVFYLPILFLLTKEKKKAFILFLIVISPWLIRNTLLFGDPTFTPAKYAFTFHHWSEIDTLEAPRPFAEYIADIGWIQAIGIRILNPLLTYVPLVRAPNPVEFVLFYHGIGAFTPIILFLAALFMLNAFSRFEWNSMMSTIVFVSLTSPILYGCLKAGGTTNEALLPLIPLYTILAAAYALEHNKIRYITILTAALFLQGCLMMLVWG